MYTVPPWYSLHMDASSMITHPFIHCMCHLLTDPPADSTVLIIPVVVVVVVLIVIAILTAVGSMSICVRSKKQKTSSTFEVCYSVNGCIVCTGCRFSLVLTA